MTNKTIKHFFALTEILLLSSMLLSVGSGAKYLHDRKKIKKLSTQNIEQATKIKNLIFEVEKTNQKKDEIVEKKIKVEKEIKKQASNGFSVLYEQAVDINKENKTKFTNAHVNTAKEYIKIWGYDAMAKVIKWQQNVIDQKILETKALLLEQKKLEKEFNIYKIKSLKEIEETKSESIAHERDAKTLKTKLNSFINSNSWLETLLKWGLIGVVVYIFITFIGFGAINSSKNKALNAADYFRRKKNHVVRAINTFKQINDDGNDTMDKIVNSFKFADLNEEEEHESPLIAYKKNIKK